MFMYSLFDKKAGQYDPAVLLGHSDGHMTRQLDEAFRGSKNTVEKYPDDYDLYQVGEFDQASGTVIALGRFVCNMSVVLHTNGKE